MKIKFFLYDEGMMYDCTSSILLMLKDQKDRKISTSGTVPVPAR